MDCQTCDSKKLFKVFDASKRKKTRKIWDGPNDSNSVATDDSISGYQQTVRQTSSAKASLQGIPTAQTVAVAAEHGDSKRDRENSPSASRSPGRGDCRAGRSPRRHRHTTKDSLALNAGLVSTPRSNSPHDANVAIGTIPQDRDSVIYAFLEEAIKRDKKRRHSRRYEDRDRNASDQRHHHRRHHDDHSPRREDHVPRRDRTHERSKKDGSEAIVNQTVLFETFAKLCAQISEKKAAPCNSPVQRTLSHKSLQCEVPKKRESYEGNLQPVRQQNLEEHSRNIVPRILSHKNLRDKSYSQDKIQTTPSRIEKPDKYCCYDKDSKYISKINMTASRTRNITDIRYPEYPAEPFPPRNTLDHSYRCQVPENGEYRDYDRDYNRQHDERRNSYEQKTSRSYDVHREYPEDDKYRRTARSDNIKEKHYEGKERYYDDKHLESRDRFVYSKDKRVRRPPDRFDRNSIASREDEFRDRDRDRDRYSERERDSGLSVADGEISTVSGKSNYLRVVKQEIAEQRDAMDKMMKLWKELMRCFKGLSTQGQAQNNKTVHESAANVQESATAQLRLWRECMRRYETVARDVGDTDARLMEEINKQRSEMAEMAGMWQECLQRYREMSSDFNNLKQQVTSSKPPFVQSEMQTRLPAAPPACAEGEGIVPSTPYRLPNSYPPMSPVPVGYTGGGSPLRSRASAPPAWWWCGEGPRRSPRRRSSPDSRGSRDRDRDCDRDRDRGRDRDRRHRHKDRDRDDTRYKEKSSKPGAARSEHRHRKR